jgi:hypothetical protein
MRGHTFLVNVVASRHPRLNVDVLDPILDRWNTSPAVLPDVLLSDEPHGDLPPVRIGDVLTEYFLALEDSEGVMPQRTMPEVCNRDLRLIKPVVNWLIIFGFPTPTFLAAVSVV